MRTEYGIRTLGQESYTDDKGHPYTLATASAEVKEMNSRYAVVVAREVSPSRVVSVR